MDGRGRWMDNVFIERLWRSLKYECVYLHAFESGSELRAGLSKWIGYHNARWPKSTLAGARWTGQTVWTWWNWRPDNNQNQAYPRHKAVRTDGTNSDRDAPLFPRSSRSGC